LTNKLKDTASQLDRTTKIPQLSVYVQVRVVY